MSIDIGAAPNIAEKTPLVGTERFPCYDPVSGNPGYATTQTIVSAFPGGLTAEESRLKGLAGDGLIWDFAGRYTVPTWAALGGTGGNKGTVGADGYIDYINVGTPRFAHSGTGDPVGLRLDPARGNLIKYSEFVNDAGVWSWPNSWTGTLPTITASAQLGLTGVPGHEVTHVTQANPTSTSIVGSADALVIAGTYKCRFVLSKAQSPGITRFSLYNYSIGFNHGVAVTWSGSTPTLGTHTFAFQPTITEIPDRPGLWLLTIWDTVVTDGPYSVLIELDTDLTVGKGIVLHHCFAGASGDTQMVRTSGAAVAAGAESLSITATATQRTAFVSYVADTATTNVLTLTNGIDTVLVTPTTVSVGGVTKATSLAPVATGAVALSITAEGVLTVVWRTEGRKQATSVTIGSGPWTINLGTGASYKIIGLWAAAKSSATLHKIVDQPKRVLLGVLTGTGVTVQSVNNVDLTQFRVVHVTLDRVSHNNTNSAQISLNGKAQSLSVGNWQSVSGQVSADLVTRILSGVVTVLPNNNAVATVVYDSGVAADTTAITLAWTPESTFDVVTKITIEGEFP